MAATIIVPSAFAEQGGHAKPPASATLSWTSRVKDTFGPGDGKTRSYSLTQYNFDVSADDIGGSNFRGHGGPSNVSLIVGSKDPSKFKNPDIFLAFTTDNTRFFAPGTHNVTSGTGTQTGENAASSVHFTPTIGPCPSVDTKGTFTVTKALFEFHVTSVGVLYHPMILQIHFDLRCDETAGVFTGDFIMTDKTFGTGWTTFAGSLTGSGDGSGDGTGDGSGGTPQPLPPGPIVVLPDSAISTPPVMANSTSTTVPFTTFIPTNVTSDVTLSTTTDAEDLIASISPGVIPLGGSGDAVLTIRTTPTTQAGIHTVTITASDGVTSNSASVFVTVTCDPPFILGIDQPKSTTVSPGRPALLSVRASGSGPFTYQWFTGSTGLVNFPLAGGTTPNFTTSAINDTTQYWVRVTNPCGSADSQAATINVSAGAKPTRR
jgi:hypothetical protein